MVVEAGCAGVEDASGWEAAPDKPLDRSVRAWGSVSAVGQGALDLPAEHLRLLEAEYGKTKRHQSGILSQRCQSLRVGEIPEVARLIHCSQRTVWAARRALR